MKDTRNFDRVPLKDIRVKDNQIGIRTPQILISRKKGDYMKGDVLDANATTELAKSIHMPDIDKINQKLEQTVNKDQIGQPNGVAGLDSTGNVPIDQLGNIDTDLFMVVSELPTEDIKEGKIYCIKDTTSTAQDNGYIEYAYINNKWEKIGEFQAEPDLSGYANKSDVLLNINDNGGYYVGQYTTSMNRIGDMSFSSNTLCTSIGDYSHAEGVSTVANGIASHAEGCQTTALRDFSHAEGTCNVRDANAIHSIGIGEPLNYKNAEYIYLKDDNNGEEHKDDPKNGYKYLIGVGGYDGISIDTTTYKSVQEVIADLTARIEQLETKVKALKDANTPA